MGKKMADLTPVDPSAVQETGPEEPTSNETYIQKLEDEISHLRSRFGGQGQSDINTPVPGSRDPVPGTRSTEAHGMFQDSAPAEATSGPVPPSADEEKASAAKRPLLDGVDVPTNENGTPDMKMPGAHQNPVSYAHLSNGTVVKIAGLVPTYIHDGEELLKVIMSSPMLRSDGSQMLAGLLKVL